jgi:hypothetical protein
MSEIVIPKQSLKSLGLDWRRVVEDYRTKTGSTGAELGPEAVEFAGADFAETNGAATDGAAETAPETVSRRMEDEMAAIVKLPRFQEPQGRKRLDEIAAVMLSLTYGEMIEMADALWRAQPEGSAITQENLPALLHRWSRARTV